MKEILEKYQWVTFSLFFWSASLFILLNFNGTGKEADSINHFLYAKYAPTHPKLYLNHWAKPVFTFLASPFAQFGFLEIKLFNVLCTYGASFFIFKIARGIKISKPILAPIFYFIFPISFLTTFSGLTEPLCALVLSASILLFQQKNYLIAAALISFTPFIRSEGLILIGVFGLFYSYLKNWKALLLLSLGHIIYTLIGFISGEELLWVFTKIPYAHLSSQYGSGGLFHFAEKLIYLLGIPLLIFFILGLLAMVIERKKQTETSILVVTLFLCFFIAHSLFWYLEVFNSMGLKRVFAAVTPLMALICWMGFQLLEKINHKKIKRIALALSIVAILGFNFTKNPAAVEWEDLNLTEAQENAKEVGKFLQQRSMNFGRLIYTDPFLSHSINHDPFVKENHQILAPEMLKFIQPNDLIIWDNWHSVVDYGVHENLLSNLSLVKEFNKGKSVYRIYKK